MFQKLDLHNDDKEVLTVFSQWYLHTNDDVVLLLLDEKMQIIQATPSVYTYFSFGDQPCTGMNFFQLVPHEIFIQKDLSNEQMIKIPKFKMMNQDEDVYFSLTIEKQIVRNDTYYFCLLQDITESTALENMMINHQKLIETATLATGFVHEFRNPLTSLKGFLQLLRAGVQQKEAYYEVMINEIEKLEQLSTGLLQMGKPDVEHRSIENISKLIDDVLFILQTQSHLQNIHYDVCIEDDYELFVDGRQLKQVFLNLCKNSAEAMDYHGTIYLHVFHNEYLNEVVIEIKDEGQGMPDQIIKEWKRPFYTTKSNGTGLGLMISDMIIKNHNGYLMIENDKEIGMLATITLPLHSKQ